MKEGIVCNALMRLLRRGLWGEREELSSLSLSATQWMALYQAASRHTVEGIVYDGIQSLEPACWPPRDLMIKWTVRVDRIERQNKHMNSCIAEQVALFKKQGLDPVLLKGQGLAACYPEPLHRISGDVDWYFGRKADYQAAGKVIGQAGIPIKATAGFSSEYAWRGTAMEHHQRMFDIHNPFSFPLLKRLQERYAGPEAAPLRLAGSSVRLLSPILMAVQVNVHILKHLLSFGIGLRQLCDSARLYSVHKQAIDGQELKEIYGKLGILPWINCLHQLLVDNIGMPEDDLPFDLPAGVDAAWMMEDIWTAGNFGFTDPRFGGSAAAGRQDSAKRILRNTMRYVRYAPMEAISFPFVHFYSRYAAR